MSKLLYDLREEQDHYKRILNEERYNAVKVIADHISDLEKQNKLMRKLLKSVNDHAETCSIFIYNDKGCTCYYENIQEFKEEDINE